MRQISSGRLSHLDDTRDEPWIFDRVGNPHYGATTDYALRVLGEGPGKCLVIGSPLFEVLELKKSWEVTYVDVRRPPDLGVRFIQGDASSVDLEGPYDVASSSCVLCHAGLGRYGDPIVDDADYKIMKNIHGNLKKGGLCVVTVGCVADVSETTNFGQAFRVWDLETAKDLMRDFKIMDWQIYDSSLDRWKKGPLSSVLNMDYLSFTLEK